MDYSNFIEKNKKHFFRERFEACGIPFVEGIVLLVIGKHLLQNQDNISLSSGIDKYRIAKLMSKLENKKLITRETNQSNKREKLVELTEAGKGIYEKLSSIEDEWELLCFTNFSKEEKEWFETMLKKISKNIENI